MPIKREDKKGDIYWARQKYVEKAYIFDLCDDDFVAVAIHGGLLDCKIAYAKPGDDAWTYVWTPPRSTAQDVLRLGTKLFVVLKDGKVGYFDIAALQKSEPRLMIREYLPVLSLGDMSHKPYRSLYLVEASGDLLFVYRNRRIVMCKNDPSQWDMDACYITTGFDVYLFNFKTNSWKIVKDLGDVSLFVGNNCSLAVNGCAKKNLKSNCIYYTDDLTIYWGLATHYGGHDMGIYHLENRVIEPLYIGDDIRSSFCPAFWFLPKFFC